MTKIIKLEVENIKRLQAIEITPAGNVVVVGGKNGQGKSSTLDAIWYALGGAGALPTEPLRQGTTMGYAKLKLDNGLTVTRRVMENGNTSLKVETEQGILKSPQAVLDKMVGSISFDPMAFARMDPRPQMETLRALVGIDTTALDTERFEVYSKRTQVNTKLRELDVKIGDRRPNAKLPDTEVSVAELMDKLGVAENHQDSFSEKIEDASVLDDKIGRLADQVTDTELRLKRLKAEVTTAKREWNKLVKMVGADPDKTEAGLQSAIDTVKDQITKADSVNAEIRENQELIDLVTRLTKGKGMSQELTDKLTKIDTTKQKTLAKMKFPVKGLSFDVNGVRFNDVPFGQCSSAEQTRVSVGMALAMNPELKVLLIRDGSLLDEDSFALIAKMAKKADAQVWIEAVSTDADKCAVIIEDGRIACTGGGASPDEKMESSR